MAQSKTQVKRPSIIAQTIKRWFLLGALGIVTLFGILGLFGENGVLDMFQLKTLHRSLTGEIRELESEQEELQQEIHRLGDPRYVEYLAREQLGLMGSNELFIVLDGQDPRKH